MAQDVRADRALGAERGFYRGPVAEAMVRAARQSADARRPPTTTWRPGLMTERDLRDYRAIEREPTHVEYRGLDVFGMGPPSSGGSTVGEALNILERLPGYGALPETTSCTCFLEASRYAFADRNVYLADPDFIDVPLRGPAVGLVRGRARAR